MSSNVFVYNKHMFLRLVQTRGKFLGIRLKDGSRPGFTRFWINRFWKAGFKEPEILPSLEQRLAAEHPYDEEVERLMNIGAATAITKKEAKSIAKDHKSKLTAVRKDPAMEKAARTRSLNVPLDEVLEEWRNEAGPEQICGAAVHYGIFNDMFGKAFFLPHVPLKISFSGKDYETPVYRGNHIAPSDALGVPSVNFKAPDDNLWTLMLVNLDGNLQDSNREYIHWFIGNIPGGNVSKGDTVVNYLQPIPVRGTGFHRYVFVLFKQEGPMDYSSFKLSDANKPNLSARSFHMKEFYNNRQDRLTASGLAFFLTEWDDSVTDYFHQNLDTAEPAFEYEHRPIYIRPQVKYPANQPFNLYLDRYRDRKEIAEEMVKRRLAKISPFEREAPRDKWPMANTIDQSIPTWKQMEIRKERLGLYRYKLLYDPTAKWG